MAEVTLTGLLPNTLYSAQFRSKTPDGETPWSSIYMFRTIADSVKPAAVTDLVFESIGTSFVARWTRPALNEDGSPFRDFKDYEVTVGTGVYTTKYYVTTERFEFTLEMNKAVFLKARATVPITVAARDTFNNTGVTASATALNPPPAAPTGVTANAVQGGVSFTWNPNTTDNDFDRYRVYGSTTPAFTIVYEEDDPIGYTRPLWEGNATGFTYQTLTILPHYFEVQAVDTSNSHAVTRVGPVTPIDPFFVDVNPPTIPGGWQPTVASTFDAVTNRAKITVSWDALTADDLAGYKIRYAETAGGTPTFIDVGPNESSVNIFNLPPGQTYYVSVQAYDYDANPSVYYNATPYPITTAADTTTPGVMPAPSVVAGATSATVFWNDVADSDVANGNGHYEVRVTYPNATTTIHPVAGTVFTVTGLAGGSTYLFAVRPVDSSGHFPAFSTNTSKTILVPGQFIGADELQGSVIAAGSLVGDRLQANTVDANTLKANTAFNQNLRVANTFVLGGTGVIAPTVNGVPEIVSSNYSTTNKTGFRLTDTGLDILSGTIAAKALLIQDGANLMPFELASFEMRADAVGNYIVGTATGLAISAAQFFSGTQSLTFNANGTVHLATGTTGGATNVLVAPNTTYIISYYAMTTGTANLAIRARNQSATDIFAPVTQAVASTWTRYTYSFTTGASDTAIYMWLDATGGGVVYLDAVQLERQQGALTTPSPFKPPGITSITGGLIKTGSIQSTSIVGGQPAWAINVAGNATFADARINGTMVVNSSSAYAIQSSNYDGTNGWAVKGDGSVFFASGTFKGTLSGGSVIGGTINIGNYSFNVDSSGNMWMGSTSYGSAPFRVSAGGILYAQSATISGSIAASSIQASYGGMDSTGNLWAGNYYYGSSPFRVSSSGGLYANNADITGSFTTGGITLSNGNLFGPSFSLYASGAFYANSANITGNINSGSLIQGSTIAGSNITTGAVSGTTPYGQRVELMATNGYDTIRFYPYQGIGGAYVDIRGQTGVWGGYDYINGFYINGTTQIGNTQSVIYQVGRRDTGYSSSRVRAGTQTLTFNGGAAFLSWAGMDTAPEWVVVTPVNGNYHLYTDVPQYNGVWVYARLGTAQIAGGAAANLRVSYYTEYMA